MQVDIPFGETTATVTGKYYPPRAGRMYLKDGSPGWPDEPAEFEIETFEVGGEDILDALSNVFVQKQDGTYVEYFDTVLDTILEKAYINATNEWEEHCKDAFFSRWCEKHFTFD